MNIKHRKRIVEMVHRGGDGHIPSAFSIIDIIDFLYTKVLNVKKSNLNSPNRDFFILSKGHGCLALYSVLYEKKILRNKDIREFCTNKGILGEHPDMTKVPGAEASTGSLGHGLSFAIGIAKGLKMQKKKNKVFVLCGDGECQEGTVWEAANIARNHKLNNLILIIDFNKSGAQLLPYDPMVKKWKGFGWKVEEIDGHSTYDFKKVFSKKKLNNLKLPYVVVANTTKGKGAKILEGHGPWHHRIPSRSEVKMLNREIDKYYGKK